MTVAGFLLFLSVLIPQTNWTLHFVDSQETPTFVATKAFDGNVNTMWHTLSSGPPPPHEIQINLGAIYSVNGFRYLPRQDGGVNGWITQYEFYVSTDGINWGTAVAAGSFTIGANEQEVIFAAKVGRYIRLRALAEVNGNPWTSVAELNVIGDLILQTPLAPNNLTINNIPPPPQITLNPICAGSGFQLAAGSPAIDAGMIIPGFHCPVAGPGDGTCVEWCGTAPDIGACEYCP